MSGRILQITKMLLTMPLLFIFQDIRQCLYVVLECLPTPITQNIKMAVQIYVYMRLMIGIEQCNANSSKRIYTVYQLIKEASFNYLYPSYFDEISCMKYYFYMHYKFFSYLGNNFFTTQISLGVVLKDHRFLVLNFMGNAFIN